VDWIGYTLHYTKMPLGFLCLLSPKRQKMKIGTFEFGYLKLVEKTSSSIY